MSGHWRRNITDGAKIKLLRKQPRCLTCGELLSMDDTVDHLIPIAVAKWLSDTMPDTYNLYTLRSLLNRSANLVMCHDYCNVCKSTIIETPDELASNPYCTAGTAAAYKRLYNEVATPIRDYYALKHQVAQAIGARCAICGKSFPINKLALRRTVHNRPRSASNAYFSCPKCCCVARRGIHEPRFR